MVIQSLLCYLPTKITPTFKGQYKASIFNTQEHKRNRFFKSISFTDNIRRKTLIPLMSSVEDDQDQQPVETKSTSHESPADDSIPTVEKPMASDPSGMSTKKDENLWSGVAEEIREIEWPVFGKVLGTTGVVLAVIAGSSLVLLTVNAVLAEISDKIFSGKGVQDFFG